jgi:hypothetical protein
METHFVTMEVLELLRAHLDILKICSLVAGVLSIYLGSGGFSIDFHADYTSLTSVYSFIIS